MTSNSNTVTAVNKIAKLTNALFVLPNSQKSPAKKLSHAISKSLGCVPIGEPPHPVFPEQAERPQELTHTV